jgi:hypothetical protein
MFALGSWPTMKTSFSWRVVVLDPSDFKETLRKLKEKGVSDEEIQKRIEAWGKLSQRRRRMETEAAISVGESGGKLAYQRAGAQDQGEARKRLA